MYVGEMEASGYVGTDEVSLAGLTVKNQTVQVATKLVRPDLMNGYDGIVGLGNFNSYSKYRMVNLGRGYFPKVMILKVWPILHWSRTNRCSVALE